MSAPVTVAEVVRSGFVEGHHYGSLVVLGPDDAVEWAVGDVESAFLPRSCNKPLQALSMLHAGLDLDGDLLAVACASHSGEPFHLDAVRWILAGAGLDETALQTPPDYPLDDDARADQIRNGLDRPLGGDELLGQARGDGGDLCGQRLGHRELPVCGTPAAAPRSCPRRWSGWPPRSERWHSPRAGTSVGSPRRSGLFPSTSRGRGATRRSCCARSPGPSARRVLRRRTSSPCRTACHGAEDRRWCQPGPAGADGRGARSDWGARPPRRGRRRRGGPSAREVRRLHGHRCVCSGVRDARPRRTAGPRHEAGQTLFKIKNAPRVTRAGRFIRKYSLDELPQPFNVARGHMSLVGPRPPLPSEVAKYGQDVHRRLLVRPGMTGLWQVSGRSGLTWDEAVRLDLYYVDNWSMLTDLVIMAKTVRAVFASRGAY